ncbi:F-box/LRR-repeat protein 2-like [Achroia grisella]|uniref:F-box/LRR-repeat protein 2-like n=1 Tax=Achroia grisella TaxID=688607 RepID=UPI0027D2A6BC|nr:F-box/LRR-repeat protein 2-like [Achroia grisella]
MSIFEDDGDPIFNDPAIFRVIQREIYEIGNIQVLPYGFRNIPTHTEDGIPIRKLYVTNLPLKTTRTDLFGVFAPYGFIKSCWLKIMSMGPNRDPIPTYGFVTFSNPEDAHRALKAPSHEKMLRGQNLRTYPADSWHQPTEDSDGKVQWRSHSDARFNEASNTSNDQEECPESSTHNTDSGIATCSEKNATTSEEQSNEREGSDDEDDSSILNILNIDCLHQIMSYVPIRDLILSERVSKKWQCMVQEYLEGIRLYKTSWWPKHPVKLTTAVLRRLLARLTLTRLYIDHPWSALNDRTAHAIGKFCPDLEELKIVGMHTKNWNPLIYGCKNLKSISFISCNKLSDSSLVHLVKGNSNIGSLTVANNTHVTGLFLTGVNPLNLTSLSFYNCYSLQGTLLTAAIDSLPNLTALKMDACPATLWSKVPCMLLKLPKLEKLSLCEYASVDMGWNNQQSNRDFCDAIAKLERITSLNFSRNIYITNAVLKRIAQSCSELKSLDVSCCNSRKGSHHTGVGDEGVAAVCAGCPALERLDVSYLTRLTDHGLAAAARLPRLRALLACGLPAVSAAPLALALAACPRLEEVDVCGCDNVSENIIEAALKAVENNPRRLVLRVASTAILELPDTPEHKLLIVNITDDHCNPHFRPDFVDRILDDSSDDSLIDELFDHDAFDDIIDQADDIFLQEDDYDDDDDMDMEGFYYGFHYC